jgi:hypothetical protein
LLVLSDLHCNYGANLNGPAVVLFGLKWHSNLPGLLLLEQRCWLTVAWAAVGR